MTTLAMPALLKYDQAVTCMQSFSARIRAESGEKVLIDASVLAKFDSSALAVLLQCRRDSAALGKSLEVTGLSLQLQELANLYGISELLKSH